MLKHSNILSQLALVRWYSLIQLKAITWEKELNIFIWQSESSQKNETPFFQGHFDGRADETSGHKNVVN